MDVLISLSLLTAQSKVTPVSNEFERRGGLKTICDGGEREPKVGEGKEGGERGRGKTSQGESQGEGGIDATLSLFNP